MLVHYTLLPLLESKHSFRIMKAQCMAQQLTKSKGFDSFMYMVHTDCQHFTH